MRIAQLMNIHDIQSIRFIPSIHHLFATPRSWRIGNISTGLWIERFGDRISTSAIFMTYFLLYSI